MKNIFKDKLKLASTLLITLFIILTYRNITQIFFQQDEWFGIGNALFTKQNGGVSRLLVQIFNQPSEYGRFIPLTPIMNYIFYTTFLTNAQLYTVLALILLLISATITYLVTYKLTNSTLAGIVTAIFWATNTFAYQAYTWIGTIIPSMFSYLFFISSFLALIEFIGNKNRKYLYLSAVLILSSLWFKELGIFYIAVYALTLLLFTKNTLKNKLKNVLIIVLPLATIALPLLLQNPGTNPTQLSSQSNVTLGNTIFGFITIPIKSLFHVYLQQTQIYSLAKIAKDVHYVNVTSGYVVENVITDGISFLGSLFIIAFILITLIVVKKKYKKLIIFSVLSFFASTLPFVLIQYQNQPSILESRYFLFPALFAGMLLSSVVIGWIKKYPNILARSIFYTLLLSILYNNYSWIQFSIKKDIKVGNYRKQILVSLDNLKKDLGQNNIFYFYTTNSGFYEFQSGFMQTLAVWLHATNKLPPEIMIDKDFWDPSYQGIKQFDSQKVGYFMKYDNLLEAFNKDTSLDKSSLHAYYWDYRAHTVTRVTKEIWEKLQQDLQNAKTEN